MGIFQFIFKFRIDLLFLPALHRSFLKLKECFYQVADRIMGMEINLSGEERQCLCFLYGLDERK